jgi:hypothetical protein
MLLLAIAEGWDSDGEGGICLPLCALPLGMLKAGIGWSRLSLPFPHIQSPSVQIHSRSCTPDKLKSPREQSDDRAI